MGPVLQLGYKMLLPGTLHLGRVMPRWGNIHGVAVSRASGGGAADVLPLLDLSHFLRLALQLPVIPLSYNIL